MLKSDTSPSEVLDCCDKLKPNISADLWHIASAYRHATIVYLHDVLENVGSRWTSDAGVLQSRQIRSLLSRSKDEAVTSCMADILKIQEGSPSIFGLAPLLFIVASESRDWTESNDAFDRLTRVWKKTGLGNLGTALDLLSTTREDRIMDWRKVLKGKHWDLIVS